MSDRVIEISISNVNELLAFVGASEHLPPGWTVARVAHLVSRVQSEAAAAALASNDADDQETEVSPDSNLPPS